MPDSERKKIKDRDISAAVPKLVDILRDVGTSCVYIMHDRAERAEVPEGDIRYYTVTVRPGNTGKLDRMILDLIGDMAKALILAGRGQPPEAEAVERYRTKAVEAAVILRGRTARNKMADALNLPTGQAG